MRTSILIILFFCSFLVSKTQSINISIFNEKDINSITISIKQGRYQVKNGKETLGEYKKGAIFHISRFGDELEIRDKRNFIGNFKTIEIAGTTGDDVLSVKPINPIDEAREYDDDLILSCINRSMQIINKVDMEKYIANVIEAEGGNVLNVLSSAKGELLKEASIACTDQKYA